MSAQLAIIEPGTRAGLLARMLFDTVVEPRLRLRASRALRRWRHRGALACAERLVGKILPSIPAQRRAPPPYTWRVQHIDWTEGNVAVAVVGPAGGAGAVVLKLPHTPAGMTSLRRQSVVLRQLHASEVLGAWRMLLPVPVLEGEASGQPYFVETALPGRDMGTNLGQQTVREAAYRAAMSAIRVLHESTARDLVVDSDALVRWVDTPAHGLRTLVRNQQAVDDLVGHLRAALLGQTVRVGWIHGDFWPRNLLVADDHTTLTGIVDWDLAAPDELPMHDVFNMLLATPQIVEGQGLGDIVRARLNGAPWDREKQAILDEARYAMLENIDQHAVLMLYWLRFIATYLRKCPERASDDWWMKANVERVLQTFGGAA